MTEQEKMIDKIQKLLAKAERTNSEPEAEAFYSKAQELMTKWAVDDAMLASHAGSNVQDELGEDSIKVAGTYFQSDVRLAGVIARANNCRILQAKWSHTIHFIGFQSDRERCKLLFASLQIQCARFAKRECPSTNDYGEKLDGWNKYVWKRSFRFGFADTVGRRLREAMERTVKQEDRKSGGNSLLPVLADRKGQVERFFEQTPHGKGRASNLQANWSGGAAGRRAGDRADLGQPRVGGRKEVGK